MPGPPLPTNATDDAATLRLRRTWRRWCFGGMAALGIVAAALLPDLGGRVLPWVIVNLGVLAAILGLVYRRLRLNRRTLETPLIPALGAGTHLTVLRGVLIAQLPGYLLLPWPEGSRAWLPALTYAVALVADGLDGYLARRTGIETRLGASLDIEFDGIGVLAATALAAHYGRLPLAYLATVGSARYLYLLGAWVTRRLGRTVHPLSKSTARRRLALAAMLIGEAALWPIAPPAMISLGAALIGVPFLVGFARDLFVLVGALDPGGRPYGIFAGRLDRLATVILPPFLRLLLLVLLGPVLFLEWRSAEEGVGRLALALISLGLVLVGLGVAGRMAAAGLAIAYGLTVPSAASTTRGLATWAVCLLLFFLGSGAASLASPEAPLFDPELGRPR